MSKLLIYIGENQKFDLESTVRAITAIEGVSNARQEKFIGAVFECNYTSVNRVTVVRISEDLETVTVEGVGHESADFAVKFQQKMHLPLQVIDMEYSFNFALSEFESGEDLIKVIQ